MYHLTLTIYKPQLLLEMMSSLNEIAKCQNLLKTYLLGMQGQLRKEKLTLDKGAGKIPILKKPMCKFRFLSRGTQSSKERQPARQRWHSDIPGAVLQA